MNDFDDRLSRALRDDDVDRTRQPDLGAVHGAWRRRRHRRLGAIGAALSVVVLGSGFAIATLAQNDPDERVVTDTAPSTEPLVSVRTAPAPTTDDLVPLPITEPPVSTTPVGTAPVSTAPVSTETTVSVPATEVRGLDVVNQYIDATTVFDLANRLEIRDAGNEALWSYQYCAAEQRCSATVQTVLDDGVWIIVGDDPDENGFPTSSTLRRVDFDGVAAEVRADTEAGTYLAAGQPTVLGELLAVAKADPIAPRLIEVSVTSPDGEVRTLATDVTDVEVSADGRYVATTAARPSEDYGRVYLKVWDLQTGRSNDITLQGVVTAAPLEFSVDGARLVMRNTWELESEFIIDPWDSAPELVASDSAVAGSEVCLVGGATAAVATWQAGYGESSVTNGTIRLVDVETGGVTTDLGLDTFGRGLVCGPDDSVTFLRVAVRDLVLGSEDDPFVIVEPDYGAPVDIVRVAPDGSQVVLDSGAVVIRSIR